MQTKEHVFQSKACAEFAKLRTVQAELEQEAGQACFLGCSVIETGWLPVCVSVPQAPVYVGFSSEPSGLHDCMNCLAHARGLYLLS